MHCAGRTSRGGTNRFATEVQHTSPNLQPRINLWAPASVDTNRLVLLSGELQSANFSCILTRTWRKSLDFGTSEETSAVKGGLQPLWLSLHDIDFNWLWRWRVYWKIALLSRSTRIEMGCSLVFEYALSTVPPLHSASTELHCRPLSDA